MTPGINLHLSVFIAFLWKWTRAKPWLMLILNPKSLDILKNSDPHYESNSCLGSYYEFLREKKANSPGQSLWLLTATHWVWRERLCELEPPPSVRWLSHHGDRGGQTISPLLGAEMFYLPGKEWDGELWPPTWLLIHPRLMIQNAQSPDYPANKAKSRRRLKCWPMHEVYLKPRVSLEELKMHQNWLKSCDYDFKITGW